MENSTALLDTKTSVLIDNSIKYVESNIGDQCVWTVESIEDNMVSLVIDINDDKLSNLKELVPFVEKKQDKDHSYFSDVTISDNPLFENQSIISFSYESFGQGWLAIHINHMDTDGIINYVTSKYQVDEIITPYS